MALGMNDFRSIVIKADAANTSIAPIRLSQNDQDGRRIVFELWNGAESIAATGLTARLLFGVGEGGYATMTAVTGAATATWAVDVPQEALQTAGVVRMAVEVASGSQAVCTRIFDAVVEPAIIDEDSPEAQDALSEFRAAVARLEDFTVPVPISNGGTNATTASNARANLGALAKAGDIATGSIGVKSSNIDRDGSNPSSTQTGNTLYLCDKDNQRLGIMRVDQNTDGSMRFALAAFNEAGNTELGNWLTLVVGKDGTNQVSVTDAAAWRSGIGAVSKSGDTMSGDLTLIANEYVKSSNIESGTRPGSNTAGKGFQFWDKNGDLIGVVGPKFYTDGVQVLQHVCTRRIGNSDVGNTLAIGVDENGGSYYSLSDVRAWQKMVGMSGAVISAGSTWSTSFMGSSALVTISRGSYWAVGLIDYWSTSLNVIAQSTNAQNVGLPTITKSANSYSFSIKNDHNMVSTAVKVISIPMESVS